MFLYTLIDSECVQLHFVVPVSQTSTSLKVIDPDTDKSFPPTKGTTVGIQQDIKLKTKSNNSYHISVNATQQPRLVDANIFYCLNIQNYGTYSLCVCKCMP